MNVIDMLPSMVQRLLKCEHDRDLRVLRNLDIVDLFAGKARVARWGELLNLRVAALDREFGQRFDICTDLGLANTVCTILRVRESGMCMMGPQCSSWVWICFQKKPWESLWGLHSGDCERRQPGE